MQPIVGMVASLIGDCTTERLAPTSLAEWSAQQQLLQGREAWETARDWIDRVNPRFSFGVAERYMAARATSDAEVKAAKSVRDAVVARMDEVLAGGAVVCLPTAPTPAPPTGQSLSSQQDLRSRIITLTCIAGTTGRPQINLPLAEMDGLPVGLSLMGPRGSEELLIAFAREVATALGS